MFYNDDDKEKPQTNWKNSEVMRIFAEQYVDQMEPPTLLESEPITEELAKDENQPTILDEAPEDDALAKFLAESWREEVQDSINKLAELTKKADNEKALYLIERSIDQLKAILDGDDK